MLTARRCAVVGHPVAHSLSPAMHRAAYEQLGLDWTYDAVDVEPGGLTRFVAGLDASWRALSITAPHKDDAVAFGEPDDVVELTGAANTWVRGVGSDGRDLVRNTDVPGYGVAFAAHGVRDVASALLVGNGATARSALVGLARLGVGRITVLARRPERAVDLVALAERLGVRAEVVRLGEVAPEADLLVSTVPAEGPAAHAEQLVGLAPVVFDSVYDPWPTPLAAAAERRGRLVLNGLDLLAGQAVEQVRWMTGGQVGFELLRSAAQDAIGARGRL